MAFRSRVLPSRGCNKCRAKKIRCDETKPICQNCIRVAYPECKYRDEFERTWRIHTEETVSRTTPKKPKPSFSPIMTRLFFDFTSGTPAAPGVSISWFDALPSIYMHADPESLLHKSVKALAYANHAKRCGNVESLQKSSELYGEALQIMRRIILSGIDVPKRVMLASVILLGIHEAFFDPSISPSGSWLSHVGGATVLLKKQHVSEEDASSPLDLQIRSMIFRQVLHGSLLSGIRPAMSWEDDITLQNPHLRPVSEHSSLLHQTAVICSQWRTAFADIENKGGVDHLADVTTQATKLEDQLEHWARNLPRQFTYESKPITVPETPGWLHDLLSSSGAPRFWHESEGPLSQMLWRFYWEARLILCQAFLHANHVLNSRGSSFNPVHDREHEIESRLLHVIDRIFESCATPLVSKSSKLADGEGLKSESITSLQGYLMLHLVPTVDVCLDQTTLRAVQGGLESRRSWIKTMKDVVQLHLGYSKAAAEIDRVQLQVLPVQLWWLAEDSSGSSGRQILRGADIDVQ